MVVSFMLAIAVDIVVQCYFVVYVQRKTRDGDSIVYMC